MNLAELPLQLGKRALELRALDYKPKLRRFLTDNEMLALPCMSRVMADVELFPNYFLVGFKHSETNTYFYAEQSAANFYATNLDRLSWIMFNFKHITFNGRGYDMPIIEAVMRGADLGELKKLSDGIILGGERKRAKAKINHVDLFEVTPLGGSLKLYGARVHCERIQDLPVDPHKELTQDEIWKVREYNCNDLDTTQNVYDELAPSLALRDALSEKYQTDLRSHSDAQIAEVILETSLRQRTGKFFKAPDYKPSFTFRYTRPPMLAFRSPVLNAILERIEADTFRIDANGYAVIPQWLSGFEFELGPNRYRMGGGGLHSCEECVSYYTDENWTLLDYDVASYYPYIILNCGLYPAHIGPIFLECYRDDIVNRRIAAKRAKNMPEADSLKIASNGVFGKTSNKYSIVYSPEIGTFITVTGQLLLLMQIEWVAEHGIHPISANTDGVVYRCPKGREAELAAILDTWAARTGFPVEQTAYKSYHARDVNNFIALKEKGESNARFLDERLGCKTKGAYCERGSALNSVLSHNPEHLICQDAVLHFLTQGTPLKETIEACRDIRRFVSVRNVRGGGHFGGLFLGRVVRWYYATNEHGDFRSIISGNKVANTEGAKPLMEIDEFPTDINFLWYINKAREILADIGVSGIRPKQPKFF